MAQKICVFRTAVVESLATRAMAPSPQTAEAEQSQPNAVWLIPRSVTSLYTPNCIAPMKEKPSYSVVIATKRSNPACTRTETVSAVLKKGFLTPNCTIVIA